MNAAGCRDFGRGDGPGRPVPAGQLPVFQRIACAGAGVGRPSATTVEQCCPRSGRFAVVIPQQAAETFPTLYVAEGTPHLVTGHEDPIAHPLVITFVVIMGEEFSNRVAERVLPEENHPLQARFFN